MSFGGLSAVTTICLWASRSALNVWKNSSCVPSFPARNCTSSTSSTSTVRYLLRNAAVWPCWMAQIISFVKRSAET